MRFADKIFGCIMAGLGILCFIEAGRVWNGWGGTGSMPLIVGGIFTLLSIMFIISPSHIFKDSAKFDKKEMISVVFIGGSFALYIIIIKWIGFLISTWFFLTLVAKYTSKSRLVTILLWTGVVALCSHIIFKKYLGMYLPTGFMGV